MADHKSLNQMYTAKDVAEFTGYPYRQLWSYLKRGTLPEADYRVGNKPLWLRTTLEQWEETNPHLSRKNKVESPQ